LLAAGALALLGLTGLGVTPGLLRPAPGVTRANCERVREGMTLADVKELLGREPDFWSGAVGPGLVPVSHEAWWWGEDTLVLVRFDRDKKAVTSRRAVPLAGPPPSPGR
jgi:hypothetical protein